MNEEKESWIVLFATLGVFMVSIVILMAWFVIARIMLEPTNNHGFTQPLISDSPEYSRPTLSRVRESDQPAGLRQRRTHHRAPLTPATRSQGRIQHSASSSQGSATVTPMSPALRTAKFARTPLSNVKFSCQSAHFGLTPLSPLTDPNYQHFEQH